MIQPRVKRGAGPKSKLTKATYRRKALPHLLKDFESKCAYCLDPSEFRHPSQNHIDHFDCNLGGRRRHQYKNLMLSCSTCNGCKHDKPVVNKFDSKQHLINCTLENEFPTHISEKEDGSWLHHTPAGFYHLKALCLDEPCHNKKRSMRRKLADRILSLYTHAIQYVSYHPAETHRQIMDTAREILRELDNMPPLVVEKGVVTVREWLRQNGVVLD